MAKNTTKPANTQAPKQPAKPAAKKTPKTPKTPSQEQTVETVETTEVETPVTAGTVVNLLNGHQKGSLDANRRMDMLTNMRVLFHDDPRARQNLGDDIVDAIDDITRAGLICALADQAVNGDDTFSAVLKSQNYPALVVTAEKMGIKLPALKALPAGAEEGTVVVNSNQIEVSEEAAEQLQNEKEIENAGNAGEIELDPEKVAEMSEEDLKKALSYILITGPKKKKSVKDTLTSTVDFMHAYRIALARKAENSTDAMNAIEDRTMRDELRDVFSYITPTYLLSGIGKGMWFVTKRDKSPISAFMILRGALTDRNTKMVVWDDQSIADAVFAIIELMCNSTIDAETKAIEGLDPKKDKDVIAAHQKVIDENNEVLGYITDISFDIIDGLRQGTDWQMGIRGNIWKMYFPTCEAEKLPKYKNLFENIEQRAGVILNLFRAPGNKHQNYAECNITEIEEYTAEEYDALVAAKKKAEAEKKKSESKKD